MSSASWLLKWVGSVRVFRYGTRLRRVVRNALSSEKDVNEVHAGTGAVLGGCVGDDLLTVLSINLLAPLYVRPLDERTGEVQAFAAFEWCADEDLEWEKVDGSGRKASLIELMKDSAADAILLQEVQFEASSAERFDLPPYLRDFATNEGYAAVLPSQEQLAEMGDRNEKVLRLRAPVGNAMLLRNGRLELAISDSSSNRRDDDDTDNSTTVVSAFVRGSIGSPLSHLHGLSLVSLHCDATSEEKRVKQLAKCFTKARAYGVREMVFGGDMNSEVKPGSCLAAMFAEQDSGATADDIRAECLSALRLEDLTEEQENEWDKLRQEALASGRISRCSLQRAPTGKTRAALDHVEAARLGVEQGPMGAWALDHILYAGGRQLELDSVWATLDADPGLAESLQIGLPNKLVPSDHLPVCAAFRVGDSVGLSAPQKDIVLKRKEDLLAVEEKEDDAQKQELARQEAEQLAVETAEKARQGELQEDSVGEKKKGKQNAKPSEAMILLKRNARSAAKVLKAKQAERRAELVRGLSVFEADALEDSFEAPKKGGRAPPTLDEWIQMLG